MWDLYTKENIVQLESIQRTSVRFVYSTYSWCASPSALVKKAELDSLQSRRHADRLQYLYLLYHNKIGIKKDDFIQPHALTTPKNCETFIVELIFLKTHSFRDRYENGTCFQPKLWNARLRLLSLQH